MKTDWQTPCPAVSQPLAVSALIYIFCQSNLMDGFPRLKKEEEKELSVGFW